MIAAEHELWHRRDRLATWLVLALVIVALLVGWALRVSAETRTISTRVDDLQLRYPEGWVKADVDGAMLFEARDPWATPAHSLITLERRPVASGVENAMGLLAQTLSIQRGQEWTAYRVLETDASADVKGGQGTVVRFAYIDASPNPFYDVAPVLMYGEDRLFQVGDNVYIVTAAAAEDNWPKVRRALDALVDSLTIG